MVDRLNRPNPDCPNNCAYNCELFSALRAGSELDGKKQRSIADTLNNSKPPKRRKSYHLCPNYRDVVLAHAPSYKEPAQSTLRKAADK